METKRTMSYLDTDMIDELLDALDMAMPDAESHLRKSSLQGVIQATFQWSNAETNSNMHVMFPTWVSHTPNQLTGPVRMSSPFQQQQAGQQHLLQRTVLDSTSGTARLTVTTELPLKPFLDCPKDIARATAAGPTISPFAGLDISSIKPQPATISVAEPQIGEANVSPAAYPAAVASAAIRPPPAAAAASATQCVSPAAAAILTDCSSNCGARNEQQQHQGDVHQQQQQQQQEQGEGGAQQQQQQQHGRRGRPPKVQGKYSKGYSSILKYRQKKQDMVHQMEQEVAAKLDQLKELQQQQQQLLSKATMLEQSMGAQETLLTQMSQLRLSVGPMQPYDTATVDGGVPCQQQQQQQHQQIDTVTVPSALPKLLQKYQQYIQDAAAALAVKQPASEEQQKEQIKDGSNSKSSSGSSFPEFPFSIVDTLSLWRLNRVAGVPNAGNAAHRSSSSTTSSSDSVSGNAAAATDASRCGDVHEDAPDMRTLNLATWLHDPVPADHWKQIAHQLGVLPHQLQQLAAAWQLYGAAVQKLNTERQQLLQKLQLLLQMEEKCTPATAAAAAQAPSGALSGCICTPLSGEDLLGYMDVANAVEWNLVRGRAMVMLFGWSMMCVLTNRQIGILCVNAWPHFPLVRAVVAHLLHDQAVQPT